MKIYATKLNRQYTISEDLISYYSNKGFSISVIDDEPKLGMEEVFKEVIEEEKPKAKRTRKKTTV